MDSGALGAPEAAEARQQKTHRELDRVLRHALERPAREHSCDNNEQECSCGAGRGEPEPPLSAAERDHDEYDLEPFQQNALERDSERVPVEPGTLLVPCSGGLLALPPESRVLVVKGLVPA